MAHTSDATLYKTAVRNYALLPFDICEHSEIWADAYGAKIRADSYTIWIPLKGKSFKAGDVIKTGSASTYMVYLRKRDDALAERLIKEQVLADYRLEKERLTNRLSHMHLFVKELEKEL